MPEKFSGIGTVGSPWPTTMSRCAGVEIGEAKAVVANKMGFSETNEISAGSILVRVAEVNACAIDGPISHENLLPLCVSFAPCVSPS